MRGVRLVTVISIILLASCRETPVKTVENLRSAIDVENNASARYNIFAAKAYEEGYFEISALFQAIATSEDIHAKNQEKVLESLGVRNYPSVLPDDSPVATTKENLRASIAAETYEYTTMYPQYIKTAREEDAIEALTAFMYANDSEKGHAALCATSLERIYNAASLPSIYYVCSRCGNLFAEKAPTVCELCDADSDTFLVSVAQTRAPMECSEVF